MPPDALGAIPRNPTRQPMKSHDLNSLTLATASARGLTFAEARRELSRRGEFVCQTNRRRQARDRERRPHSETPAR